MFDIPIETKHTEKSSLYQMMLVANGIQSIHQAICAMKAIMEPEDVALVEKHFMDMLKALEAKDN